LSFRPVLVLASSSPRRTELLRSIGVRHEIVPSPDDEPATGAMPPAEHVLVSALEKAKSVARGHPGRLVLGADTVVATGPSAGDVLGKPRDRDDAARMLSTLSGRSHDVLTGVALVRGDRSATASATTTVTFARFPERLVERYVGSGEPLDKAGAYAVQGLVATHVTRIEGSWPNVVGLPLELLPELMSSMGEELADWQDW
jgi:septum formation protein